MSYASIGEVQTSVCTSDTHCGGGYICCQGTCATPDESLCSSHPKYQGYAAPPPSDTPTEYMPPLTVTPGKPTPTASMGGAGKVLLVLAAVGVVVGGGVYAWRRKKRGR